MKTLRMMMAAGFMLVATLASSQQQLLPAPKANIPFNFKVGDHILPAGKYQVRVVGKALILTSESGERVAALSHGVQAVDPAETSQLEFVNNDGKYELYRFWQAGFNSGMELSLGKANRKVAQQRSAKTDIPVGL